MTASSGENFQEIDTTGFFSPSLILSLLFEGRTPGNTFGHLWFLVSSIFGTFTDYTGLSSLGESFEASELLLVVLGAAKHGAAEKIILASRGGKRAQKTPNIPKSWGAEQKNPKLPQ